MPPASKQCQRCIFFVRDMLRPKLGQCRRNSPRPYVLPGGFSDYDLTLLANWPRVEELDWCGDYAAEQAAKK